MDPASISIRRHLGLREGALDGQLSMRWERTWRLVHAVRGSDFDIKDVEALAAEIAKLHPFCRQHAFAWIDANLPGGRAVMCADWPTAPPRGPRQKL